MERTIRWLKDTGLWMLMHNKRDELTEEEVDRILTKAFKLDEDGEDKFLMDCHNLGVQVILNALKNN